MTRSNRGAARVSIAWMITVVVLFFAAVAFAFAVNSDLTSANTRLAAAQSKEQAAVDDFQAEADRAREISRAVGWIDVESADPRVDLPAMATQMESFKDQFGITDASVTTLQDLLPAARKVLEGVRTELKTERDAKNTARDELKNLRQTVTSITQQKDQEIARLNQQIADASDAYTRNEQDLTKRLGAAQAQVTDFDEQVREVQAEMDQLQRDSSKEVSNLQARLNTLANDLRLQKQPDLPDGKIVEASTVLPLAWIDIGANDRLARGTRFQILSPGPRSVEKGWGTVTRLEPETAEVELHGVDEFNPVVSGDVIVNPVYSPSGERQAVLAGRFTNPSRGELTALLARMGIEVQPKLDARTDYLILGGAVYIDEDGEPLEEPIQPTELDVYREAEGLGGINIVSLSDLRGYFVF